MTFLWLLIVVFAGPAPMTILRLPTLEDCEAKVKIVQRLRPELEAFCAFDFDAASRGAEV